MSPQKLLPGGSRKSSRWIALGWFALIIFLLSLGRTFSTRPDGGTLPIHNVEAGGCRIGVIGEVKKPGEYFLPQDATVADAISAAGGATESADPERLNLSERLLSGSVLRIPDLETGFHTTVSLSRSSRRELCTLPGIGPKLAERIIAVRDRRGTFRTVQDLLAVPGIGPKKARMILHLGGLP